MTSQGPLVSMWLGFWRHRGHVTVAGEPDSCSAWYSRRIQVQIQTRQNTCEHGFIFVGSWRGLRHIAHLSAGFEIDAISSLPIHHYTPRPKKLDTGFYK